MSSIWSTVALGDLLEDGRLSYGIVQPGQDHPGGVPIVRVTDLRDGRIDTTRASRVAPEISAKHSRTVLTGGELLVSIVGTIGEAAIVSKKLSGWNVARAIAVVRPRPGVAAEWIRRCMQTREVQAAFDAVLNTTVQSTLNLSELRRIPILLPPASVQRGIIEVLGAFDHKIAANKNVATLSLELADALYVRQESGTSGRSKIGSEAVTALGGTPSRNVPEYWTDGTVPWIASGKANESRVLEPTEWITDEALAKSAAKMMPKGATVVAITGATLGQVARLEIATSGNQSLIGIWHEETAVNDWLYFALRNEIGQLLKHATGAAQQHVNKAAVDGLEIPWPQRAGLESWGEQVRPLLDAAAAADKESLVLARTRDELLPLLMSGKIHVKDAEESAEGMLRW